MVGPTMPSESVPTAVWTAHPGIRARAENAVDVDRRPLTVRLIVKPHDLLHAAHGVAGASPLDLDDEPGPRPRADDAVGRKALAPLERLDRGLGPGTEDPVHRNRVIARA